MRTNRTLAPISLSLTMAVLAGPALASDLRADDARRTPDAAIEVGSRLLFDAGPILSCFDCGVDGNAESIVQTSLGMSTLGFGHELDNDNRVADQFTVPEGHQWTISTISFPAYQTGSGLNSTMTAVNYRIWDGVPAEAGSSVVFGDTFVDRLVFSEWSGIYRVSELTSGESAERPVMSNVVGGEFTLTTGTYWVDWQTDGSLSSGPWVPPITIPGQTETGDALRSTDGGASYNAITDGGSGATQGLPFLIDGMTTGPTLEVSGTCPGPMTISLAGGTPSQLAAVVSSPR